MPTALLPVPFLPSSWPGCPRGLPKVWPNVPRPAHEPAQAPGLVTWIYTAQLPNSSQNTANNQGERMENSNDLR